MPEPTATDRSQPKSMDDIVALCRRRGFIFQSSEIYGGINGFWDYGPLGVNLKRNLKDAWWHDTITCPPDGPDGRPLEIVGLDTTIIMHPKVWEASGHVAGFNDPMVDCRETKNRYRADKVWVVGFANAEQIQAMQRIDEELDSLKQHSDEDRQLAELLSGRIERVNRAQGSSLFVEERERLRNLAEELMEKQKSHRNALERITEASHPALFVGVEADGDDEAIDKAIDRLSKAQKAFLGSIDRFSVGAFPLTAMPDAWPKISPATQKDTLTEPRQFNLMFETYTGAVRNEEAKTYLRPETAQGIFTQFWNVIDTSRVKVPFGIAQVGKAFRNEVTPRNFIFRSREFEQMEIEFFIPDPEVVGEDVAKTREWYAYWRDLRFNWWKRVGLAGDNLILREHDRDELAHYAKEGAGTSDIEYRFPFTAPGFGELEGVAHRTNFDLRQHAEHSGQGDKARYFDQERNTRYFPHVIEPSAGADRGTLALLCEAYTPTPERKGSSVVMKFHPRMAPIKAAVFPLVKKDGMPEKAETLYRQLRRRWPVQFDEKQSIGKRYARMDEAGTPYCFTVDGDTLTDNTVTVRDRDTAEQYRIGIDKVEAFLSEKINGAE